MLGEVSYQGQCRRIAHTYLPALSIVKHAILSDESGIFIFTVYTFITSNKQKKV